MIKLISAPRDVGIDSDEIRANPGAIRDIHDDVLCDLMRTPHALERRAAPMGHTGSDSQATPHPRRRVCV